MSALKASLIGLSIGLVGYAVCAIIFWNNFGVFPLVAAAVILGYAFIALALMSAISTVLVLLIMLANKLDHGGKSNG